jgi:hypothetical protein
MDHLKIMRRAVVALALFAALGLLLAGCQMPPARAPAGGWYAPAKALSCEPTDIQHVFNAKELESCRARPGCIERREKAVACVSCQRANCCAEIRACDRDAFPPESSARAQAAHCWCAFLCRYGKSSDDCFNDERCGPATDPATDPFPALGSCIDTHCAAQCPKQEGEPPP